MSDEKNKLQNGALVSYPLIEISARLTTLA